MSRAVSESEDDGASEENEDDLEDAEIDESDDSGSEYEASDDDVVPEGRYQDNDAPEDTFEDSLSAKGIDDDEVMLDAAIQMSLDTARQDRSRAAGLSTAGAGSSKSRAPINKAAALRAAAAERRLKQDFDVDDFGMSDSETRSASSSEDEPLARGIGIGKGKGSKSKSKSKATMLKDITSSPKQMSIPELRRQRQERRRLARLAKGANKKEEAELCKKLGRKLTMVCFFLVRVFARTYVHLQAEKTMVALHKHHSELKDVWGDLKREIPIVIPQRAEQPPNMNVTLLPFQLESLYWMRNQEKGAWKGGILAVS